MKAKAWTNFVSLLLKLKLTHAGNACSTNKIHNNSLLWCFINRIERKHFIFYLYIYPFYSQESVGGAIHGTAVKQSPRSFSGGQNIVAPFEIYFFFSFIKIWLKFSTCQDREAEESATVKHLSPGHSRMARVGFEPRLCRFTIRALLTNRPRWRKRTLARNIFWLCNFLHLRSTWFDKSSRVITI